MKSTASRFRSRQWLILYALHLIIVAVLVRVAVSSPLEESLPPFHEMYTGEQISYFKELAFGCDPETLEWAPCDADFIVKWCGPVRVGVAGQPSNSDLREINRVINQLRLLIRPVEIFRDDSDPNLIIYLVPGDEFGRVRPEFPSARGVVSVQPDRSGCLFTGDVAVDATRNELVRRSLIREELTQALGLLKDSWTYSDSIFYQGQALIETIEFADIDEAVIRLHYDPRIEPGMTETDLEKLGV
ncbi:MAG: DUF2927 domain-containing protein [Chloroflexi bacterium]|nr:DUF2927 domain-containing protein [Chloroflexota bacterium]MCY3938661.1 DUF2927 domain-containing protein [Chloroflexota bacterium]